MLTKTFYYISNFLLQSNNESGIICGVNVYVLGELKMNFTIKDVAKKANVSIATVSRIINHKKGYSDKTKEKVLQAIEDLGYYPNAIARGLINKRTHTIGVIVPELSNMLTSKVISGIEKAAHEVESSVIVCHTESNGEKTMKYLQLLQEKQVDGIIFASQVLTADYYNYIKRMNIPLVLLLTESFTYPVPYVKVNDKQAAYTATQYLIDNGHRKIGMVSGNASDMIAGQPRIDGFINALKQNGLTVEQNNIVSADGFGFEDGLEGFNQLKRQIPDVTAVFAASDEIALGLLSAAYQMNILVPEQLSVIGYDNLKITEMSIPPLTTVAQPFGDMGETAAKMIFQLLETDEDIESRVFPHRIVERKSVHHLT